MFKMGFCKKWVEWIMLCIESIDYSMLIDGEKVGFLVSGRGLRQWDLLSPYLFIMYVEKNQLLEHQVFISGRNGNCILFQKPLLGN